MSASRSCARLLRRATARGLETGCVVSSYVSQLNAEGNKVRAITVVGQCAYVRGAWSGVGVGRRFGPHSPELGLCKCRRLAKSVSGVEVWKDQSETIGHRAGMFVCFHPAAVYGCVRPSRHIGLLNGRD